MKNQATSSEERVARQVRKNQLRREFFEYFTGKWPGASKAWRIFQARKKADIHMKEERA